MEHTILFKHAAVIKSAGEQSVLNDMFLTVSDGKISYLDSAPPLFLPEDTIVYNASDWILCPGLVNAHAHTPMTILRGYSDDLPLAEWLEKIWPAENALSESDYYYSSQLGIAEMISCGTTSISDMYRSSHKILQSAIDSKIKANICESITCAPGTKPVDSPQIMRSVELVRTYQNYDNHRIKCDTSIQSQFQTTPESWVYIAETARQYNMGIHMHIAETKKEVENCKKQYGRTPIELFEEYGVFGERCIASHCVFLTEHDIELLSHHKVNVVHNPQSNLKCCCGFASLKPLSEKGINIALGTDGVCSNNSGDLFEVMKFTAINQKMLSNDPVFADASSVLHMATMGGLISQGREGEAGELTVGKDADIMVLDRNHPGLFPCKAPISAMVYSAHGGHVVMTMVKGRILYEKGEFKTIDLERTRYEVDNALKKLNRHTK